MNEKNDLNQRPENQKEFVSLLKTLTTRGKAKWARSDVDIGIIYCLVGDELIQFETRTGDKAEPAHPSEKTAGIVSVCRNITYLWLPVSEEWKDLLSLLTQSPVNHKEFAGFRRMAYLSPVKALKDALS